MPPSPTTRMTVYVSLSVLPTRSSRSASSTESSSVAASRGHTLNSAGYRTPQVGQTLGVALSLPELGGALAEVERLVIACAICRSDCEPRGSDCGREPRGSDCGREGSDCSRGASSGGRRVPGIADRG
ncbi:hypothetical protein BE20_35455 [Sorangium cellulosum]|nr:hypothetical protein BE20_35455 [Sorangium cellulosum]